MQPQGGVKTEKSYWHEVSGPGLQENRKGSHRREWTKKMTIIAPL